MNKILKKVRDFLFLIIIATIIAGIVSFNSRSNIKCYQSVIKKYPDAIVFVIPTDNYKFIVVTKTKTLYILTNNIFNSEISDIIIVKEYGKI